MQKVLLKGDSDSRFTTGREASKPQGEASLSTKGFAFLVRNRRRMPGYITNGVGALAYFEDLVMSSGCAHIRSHDDFLRGRWAKRMCFTEVSKSEILYLRTIKPPPRLEETKSGTIGKVVLGLKCDAAVPLTMVFVTMKPCCSRFGNR